MIYLGSVTPTGLTKVAAALPVANVAESEGTLTNLRGRVQRFLQAKGAPGQSRPAWFAAADILIALGEKADYYTASDAFNAMGKATPAFSGMSYDSLGLKGATAAGMKVTA